MNKINNQLKEESEKEKLKYSQREYEENKNGLTIIDYSRYKYMRSLYLLLLMLSYLLVFILAFALGYATGFEAFINMIR